MYININNINGKLKRTKLLIGLLEHHKYQLYKRIIIRIDTLRANFLFPNKT